jgi:hypothetical protein
MLSDILIHFYPQPSRYNALMAILRARRAIIGFLVLCSIWYLIPSQKEVSPPSKNPQYFKDVVFDTRSKTIGAHDHCDARHALKAALTPEQISQTLTESLVSFASFMRNNEFDFWIAHGTLLGWYWNKKMLPCDTDVDVQVSAATLANMSQSFNGSVVEHEFGHYERGYHLDVNTYWTDMSSEDTANRIDARWIDSSNGKYVDITAVRSGSSGRLSCKDGHTNEVGGGTRRYTVLTIPVSRCLSIDPVHN